MQGVDYTTLVASCHELQTHWVPAKVEQVHQRDRYTLCLSLRTVKKRVWLIISWHPQAARLCIGDAPPRVPDTFTFSDQLRHQLNGLALISIQLHSEWERVVELQFAQRPQDSKQWSVFVEVMNKYSNVILANADGQIVTAAHQVSSKQSSLRAIQTGDLYSLPPKRFSSIPKSEETFKDWKENIQLVPKPLTKAINQVYSGLSSALLNMLLQQADIPVKSHTTELSKQQWQDLYQQWQWWLTQLRDQQFTPIVTEQGYSVLGANQNTEPTDISISQLLTAYYEPKLNQQTFTQLKHQLIQCIQSKLKKLKHKEQDFESKLAGVGKAESFREKADLLMAYLHEWQPGMKSIQLNSFIDGKPCAIPLNPELNAVQNAQAFYKKHQKIKRSKDFIEPLLKDVQSEIQYLEQVDDAIQVQDIYRDEIDLITLQEIRDELVQQGYLSLLDHRKPQDTGVNYRSFLTPNEFQVFVGRNNKQNDHLTFRTAGQYDLWFHAQEISGSHVLLRLDAGANVEEKDLLFCANIAAYFSRARQSDQVPVIYTQPRYVFKPKGAKPGMTVYTHETVLWGQPKKVELSV